MEKTTNTEIQTNSINLKKSVKGIYSWDLKCFGDDMDAVVKKLEQVDSTLKQKFKVTEE